ncbi:hypothetical protein FRACYDRAFT_232007 [Fragilariopsis cylindrus CCMP1102]|uniref:Uncharacterized protein n=1 Tax=Fragilariopsis cylindrus CCMP1102 TaxID=635003 RepID=A0A1E7FUP4_9STRA|nr:hypothetical protein FRACYDRAFT_232007 [Fragilariopsis cylindrus CCMP1102]|eukprot:OEU21862.1 hypothetical protein FRACYDRAFT_232007 [Fragilariopsis cylindrus CCMP1102]
MNDNNNGNGARGIGSLTNAKFSSFINREQTLLPPGPSAIKDVEKDNNNNNSDNDSNFELWTFRVPSEMNIKDLHGVELVLNGDNKKSTIQQINDKFTLKQGESVENHNFRVLVNGNNGSGKDDDSNSSSSSSDSDDDEDKTTNTTAPKYLLHPSSKTFTRHFNVNSALYTKKTEMELAPRNGPKPSFANDGTKLRHAYSSIPQRTGMKRRWMPLGVPKTKAKEIPISLMENISTKNDSKNAANATAITSDDDADSHNNDIKKKRDASSGSSSSSKKKKGESSNSKKRKSSGGRDGTTITSTTSPSPKTKRIKSEPNNNSSKTPSPPSSVSSPTTSLSKEERKSAKKAAKKEAKKLEKAAKKAAKKSAKKVKKEAKQEDLSV